MIGEFGELRSRSRIRDCADATRGQESLAMDLDDDPAPVAGGPPRFDTSKLVVVRASAEEAAAHEKLLDRMEKEAKKGIVWRRG